MRLLKTWDYHLYDFTGKSTPPYAILSHRWEAQEVSFRDMENAGMVVDELDMTEDEDKDDVKVKIEPQDEDDGTQAQEGEEMQSDRNETELETMYPEVYLLQAFHRTKLVRTRGWKKIKSFCDIARDRGLKYAWIDTCCIDKSSTVELQEAINMMFHWYKEARQCLVYMNDVSTSGLGVPVDQFCESEWFTRGWTLQELLAPRYGKILFFDRTWSLIGSDLELSEHIGAATEFDDVYPGRIGCNPKEGDGKDFAIGVCSIAQKMAWASDRKTTRPEDLSYSLMGLFGVKIPLLYGEGAEKAFLRLQQAIMQSSTDESIFAWQEKTFPGSFQPILARSVAQFRDSSRVDTLENAPLERQPILWTPKGLQMETIFKRLTDQDRKKLPRERQREIRGHANVYLTALACHQGKLRTTILLVMRKGNFERIGNPMHLRARSLLDGIEHWDRQTIHLRIPGIDLPF